MDLSLRTESFSQGNQSWLAGPHGTDANRPITLDSSAFTAGIHYPAGFLRSGTPLAELPGGKFGPYEVSDEVQVVTEGGSGLTSFTLTYAGQTTASLDDQATAAEVQAALEALSNIAPGDVVVTGNAGGPYTVTFAGTLADANVAQMTATPTGGTGTVTVTTQTAGGVEGAGGVLAGFLMNDIKVPANTALDPVGAMFVHGGVVLANLPIAVDAAGRADVAGRIWFL